MSWLVYIVRTDKGSLYTGITNNLSKRIEKHKKNKGARYLRMFAEFTLVYKEEVDSKSEALKREALIKKMKKSEKEKLVQRWGL